MRTIWQQTRRSSAVSSLPFSARRRRCRKGLLENQNLLPQVVEARRRSSFLRGGGGGGLWLGGLREHLEDLLSEKRVGSRLCPATILAFVASRLPRVSVARGSLVLVQWRVACSTAP